MKALGLSLSQLARKWHDRLAALLVFGLVVAAGFAVTMRESPSAPNAAGKTVIEQAER